MKLFQDVLVDGSDVTTDAFPGKYDLEATKFPTHYECKGKLMYYDEAECELITPEKYKEMEKDKKSDCESTYDVVQQNNLQEITVKSIAAFQKIMKVYLKNVVKVLEKGPMKKALKTNAKALTSGADESTFYGFVKGNFDNMSFYTVDPSLGMTGKCAVVVAVMTDWEAPTYYFFAPGLKAKNV